MMSKLYNKIRIMRKYSYNISIKLYLLLLFLFRWNWSLLNCGFWLKNTSRNLSSTITKALVIFSLSSIISPFASLSLYLNLSPYLFLFVSPEKTSISLSLSPSLWLSVSLYSLSLSLFIHLSVFKWYPCLSFFVNASFGIDFGFTKINNMNYK